MEELDSLIENQEEEFDDHGDEFLNKMKEEKENFKTTEDKMAFLTKYGKLLTDNGWSNERLVIGKAETLHFE